MSRRFVATVAIAALLAVAGSVAVAVAKDDDDDEGFSARLRGFREVPAVSTVASGRFEANIDEAAGTISYRLQYSSLEGTVSAAHIHLGQKDVNGGVIAFLCGGGGKPACPQTATTPITGTITAANIGTGAEAQGITTGEFAETVRAIKAGVVYANVHSSKFPGGEIRGQVDDD
ncbi:MAG TPA: CHRD domain-containing protein [Actinomycetota bacterium]|nr:CHRD domain-containing protein [Actinomycetota bacterium]